MSRLKWLLVGAVLGFASSGAVAFQESKGGSGPAPQGGAPVVKPLDTQGTGTSIDQGSGGTEIRIPGLGRLGVLPKFDFGLELLYGVNESKDNEPVVRQPGASPRNDDDVQIRGSLKHRW
ncbi:MAG: hypothetical protein ACKVP7_00120 [Hyphomicrobiaceae bacterium]